MIFPYFEVDFDVAAVKTVNVGQKWKLRGIFDLVIVTERTFWLEILSFFMILVNNLNKLIDT